MKAKEPKKQYKCRIFLKDETDMQLLISGKLLYGKIIESTGIIFMTPYKPPAKTLPLIGVVQEKSEIENENPLLINVCVKANSIIASGFINNQHIQLPVEIVYKSTCFARTPFKQSEMDMLWNKKVLILGAGTGGSKIAVELTRTGIGTIGLCDPDYLDFANISRHEGDLWDVGKPKIQVAAERMYRINPTIKIIQYPENIFDKSIEEVKEIFAGNDLIVAATDARAIQLLINELTHNLGIPCVFGGCYEEALGGEVFFTLPDENMPCLACLRGAIKGPEQKSKIDYSSVTGPEDYQGQPGLHAAVDFVTCIEIILCLAILLRESPSSKLARIIDPNRNFLLIGGPLAEGFYRFKKPFEIFYQPLSGPRKTCIVCQDLRFELMEDNAKENVNLNIEIIEEK